MTDERPKGQQQNRFYGEYIAIVESVSDPENLMRIQLRVFGVFTDKVPKEDLPWGEYLLPIGARVNDGCFTPVDIGDYVWVRFPFDGDTRRPMVIGSVHYAPGKIPNFPHESFAGSQKLAHKITGEEPAPAVAAYHKNCVYSQHGVTIEINEDRSIAITQRATGTAIRVSPQGDITLHGEKNIFMSAIENLKVIVEGDAQVDVSGNSAITTRGSCTITAMEAATVKALGGVNVDGGSGDLAGVITGKSACSFTGLPHSDPSSNVKASHG